MKIDHEIPSLHTFLEDTKWLEPCTIVVRKHLFPLGKGSCYSYLYQHFDFTQESMIEKSDLELEPAVVQDRKEKFTLAYRQLYMYAWRHFPELSNFVPRTASTKLNTKSIHSYKPKRNRYNPIAGHRLQQLARDLGFKTEIPCVDAEINMILNFLEEIRPHESYPLHSNTRIGLTRKLR